MDTPSLLLDVKLDAVQPMPGRVDRGGCHGFRILEGRPVWTPQSGIKPMPEWYRKWKALGQSRSKSLRSIDTNTLSRTACRFSRRGWARRLVGNMMPLNSIMSCMYWAALKQPDMSTW